MTQTTKAQLSVATLLLFTIMFSGCAAGPQAVDQPASKTEAAPQATHSAQLQAALEALDTEDYHQATVHFDEMQKRGQTIPASYLFDYGLGLSQNGRYAEALQTFRAYIENDSPQHNNDSEILVEIELAETKLQKQRAEKERAARMASAFSAISGELSASWKNVQQQLAAEQAVIVEPVTGMELIRVAGGCFQMGDFSGDGRPNELPVHQACIDDYYLGKHEVTQGQWARVMGLNPSQTLKGDNYPVEMVSWQEAMVFAKNLSGATGGYRLPTEAEWEYAARSSGKKEKFSGGKSADEVAWHEGNSAGGAHPVAQKQPNGLGFYDMSGNLWEWCLDRYAADYYSQSPLPNPMGPDKGTDRTLRGGSWDSSTRKSSTSYRTAAPEARRTHRLHGFRLALPLPN